MARARPALDERRHPRHEEVNAEACLERIRRLNPSLNAFVEVAQKVPEGALVLAVKDNIDVAGLHAAAGMQAYRERVAARDAPCVAALRAKGAVIVGKTLMDEAALGALGDNPFFGRCHNPLRHGYTAGGSSAGSAAAVAAGLCDAALGTDTLGSVRIPAAYCGIVGFIPSPEVIDTAGVMPLAPSFDRVGVLTPSVRAAGEVTDISLETQALTVGVLPGLEEIASALKKNGHRMTSIAPPDWKALRRAALLLIEREGAQALADVLPSLSLPVRAALTFGRDAAPERVERARAQIDGMRNWMKDCDVVVLPTTPQAAFPFDAPLPENQADYTAPASVLGLPAISIPCGRSPEGLPLGLQLIARRGADSLLLGVAASLEA